MILFYKILKISVLNLVLIILPAIDLPGQPVSLIVIDPLVEKESRNIANLAGTESDYVTGCG